MNGEGCESGERRHRKRTSELGKYASGNQRGSGVPRLILSSYRNLVGPVYQVSHVYQQVESCQNGHSQFLIPGANVIGEPIDTVHVIGSLGLPTKLLIELVERPEDQSADIEED